MKQMLLSQDKHTLIMKTLRDFLMKATKKRRIYPEGFKEEARRRILNGETKIAVSIDMEIPNITLYT